MRPFKYLIENAYIRIRWQKLCFCLLKLLTTQSQYYSFLTYFNRSKKSMLKGMYLHMLKVSINTRAREGAFLLSPSLSLSLSLYLSIYLSLSLSRLLFKAQKVITRSMCWKWVKWRRFYLNITPFLFSFFFLSPFLLLPYPFFSKALDYQLWLKVPSRRKLLIS